MVRPLAVLLVLLGLALSAPVALAASASLPDIEDEVMCVTCKVPLNTAQSPQADRQREYIRGLIAQGRDKEQIKAALVSEYGKDVLADPGGDGFNLVAWVAPIVLIGMLAAGLLVLLPRKRRKAGAATPAAATGGGPELSADDAARLDADLARYDA